MRGEKDVLVKVGEDESDDRQCNPARAAWLTVRPGRTRVPNDSQFPGRIDIAQIAERRRKPAATIRAWRVLVEIHPENPQPRLIAEVVAVIRQGGLIAYPTDSSFAFGCHIGDKKAMDRIQRIRQDRQAPQFHARLQRPVGNQPVRPSRELGLSAHQVADARALHIHSAGDSRGAEAPAEPETTHHRPAGAGPRDRQLDARGARRTDHELDAAPARRRPAADRCSSTSRSGSATGST